MEEEEDEGVGPAWINEGGGEKGGGGSKPVNPFISRGGQLQL